jgi:hypothetical protein
VLVDLLAYKKQEYTFKKKSNKYFEGMKKQREKQDKISPITAFLY